ncbi:MAG TPA: hypothetical protein VFF73_29355 [Planctomycetota bacterium]|nr:hypothetical protein [Planctomycetota bacterium]
MQDETTTHAALFDDEAPDAFAPEPEKPGSLWSRAMDAYSRDAGTRPAPPPAESTAAPKEDGAVVVRKNVETVLVSKLEMREESLRKVAQGFAELSGALTGIKSALGEESSRQLRAIELLESVPQVVALVKHGQEAQLQALAQVQAELVRQREDREQLARAVAALGQGMAAAAAKSDEHFEKAGARDAANAAKLETAMNQVAASLERSSRAECERYEKTQKTTVEKADRFERALTRLAVKLKEQSDGVVKAQEGAATTFQRSQQDVFATFEKSFATFEKSQARTVETLERLHQERARADARAWRRTMAAGGVLATALVGLAVVATLFFVRGEHGRAPTERSRSTAMFDVASSPAPSGETTLPAGMPR